MVYQPFQPTIEPFGLKQLDLSLKQVAPCDALREVVHSYLQVEAKRPIPYPVMPDGTQAVFISPDGSRVGGALTHSRDLQILQPGGYFGIRFYPGALRHFFKLDLAEITDQFADSQYFQCRSFRHLHNQIYQTDSFQRRTQLCEQWLLSRFAPQSLGRFDQALSLIYQSLGTIRVAELARRLGWTSRHLNRLFSLHTGLTTKAFIQTIRLQQACRMGYQSSINAQDLVFNLGYFDQSHLINDFNKRLYTNPSAFFKRFMSDFCNSNN